MGRGAGVLESGVGMAVRSREGAAALALCCRGILWGPCTVGRWSWVLGSEVWRVGMPRIPFLLDGIVVGEVDRPLSIGGDGCGI